MTNKFPETLSSLRKERNLSQKLAAQDLGISQALLSHYEKGIRECGLDFLCRVADYYSVSTDFLLGRHTGLDTSDSSGNLPLKTSFSMLAVSSCQRYSKISKDSLTIVFTLLQKINSDTLTHEASGYIFAAIYEIYRLLSRAGSKSRDALRYTTQETYLRLSICEQRCRDILSDNAPPEIVPINRARLPSLTKEMLRAEFESMADSLLELTDIVHQPQRCVWRGYE